MAGDARVPVVRARVNGAPMDVLLDTGTSQVLLSAPAARAAGLYLPAAEPREAFAPGYDVPLRAGVFDALELGAARLGMGVALVGEREIRLRHFESDAYAVLGCTVLSHFRVTFDFRERRIHLEPHGGPADPEPLFAEVLVNGRPYVFLVDSGATRLFLEPWAARELGLVSEREAERHARKSATPWAARFTWVRIESVSVAGRKLDRIMAAVVNTFEGAASSEGPRPAGLLGMAEFGELVWTLDFGARRLTVDG